MVSRGVKGGVQVSQGVKRDVKDVLGVKGGVPMFSMFSTQE